MKECTVTNVPVPIGMNAPAFLCRLPDWLQKIKKKRPWKKNLRLKLLSFIIVNVNIDT